MIDLDKRPSGSSGDFVVIGGDKNNAVEDDSGESNEDTEDEDKPKPKSNEMEFAAFSAQDWLANGAHHTRQSQKQIWHLLTGFILVVFNTFI